MNPDTAAAEAGLAHWGSGLRRGPRGPGRGPFVLSVLLHVLVAAGLWVAGLQVRHDLPEFVQYRVQLVSPPPTVEGPPRPVETTAPVVTPPQPQPTPTPPQPTPTPQTQAAQPKPVEAKPAEPKPAQGAEARPAPVGGENINIAMEGQEFPYPEYLQNILLQLKRYFRWGGAANLSAQVVFYIRRDGGVDGIDVIAGSGNFRFDLQAIEAVEQAGRAKAFGPLPRDWQGERLYILNTFEPQR
ncbi:MAG TPA: TonB C-terminal domain-containing protein [Longimicrobiales bacterium]|nr:TonB C-terminal domain-containing protein [Longimicrobiales bacterium]